MKFTKSNRSAFTNFLRAKYETYVGAIEAQWYPYFLCLDPSDACQLRCPTCPTGIENERRRSHVPNPTVFRHQRFKLTQDVFDAVLDELGEYLFLINFYNYGEPLLNNQLPSFVSRAKKFDIGTEVHTNLSLHMSDAFIEAILGSGLDRLHASIDGFSQETYAIHRVGGDLALVKNNLERFVRARDRMGLATEIWYNFLVFSFNEHEIPDARAYCDDLGIAFNNRDAFVDDPSWLPSYRKHEKPRFIAESARLKEGVELGWLGALPDPDETRCPPACAWHHGFAVVTSSGSVAPCCAVIKETDDFGAVKPGETTFADVWNNERYKSSRAAFAINSDGHAPTVETVCTHCPYPRFLHHLYSIWDAKVLSRFQEVFGGQDSGLERAFDLLSKQRTGMSVAQVLETGGGSSPERLFVGDENPEQTSAFVEFFQRQFGEDATWPSPGVNRPTRNVV